MNAKNVDFTGIAMLVGGAIILYAGFKIYKKTSDAVGAFGQSASEVVKNVTDIPGKALTSVGKFFGMTDSSSTMTNSIDLVIDSKKPPSTQEVYENIFTNNPGSYNGNDAPTEVDVLQYLADEGEKRRSNRLDTSVRNISYDGLGYINDAATLNANF